MGNGVLRRRRAPSRRFSLLVAGAAGALGLWMGGPAVLRQLAIFRVRQVELVGVKRLPPDAVIAALRLPAEVSVFTDTRLLAERVRGLAGVAEAWVDRRLPAALVIAVREVEPTALVPGSGTSGRALVAVDAEGRALPFDPALSGLDLPIAPSPNPDVAGILALIQAVDPAMFAAISSARGLGRGDVLVNVGPRQLLVGGDAGPEVIRAVALVARDLDAQGRRYAELDARFAGQVVVRQSPSVKGGGGGGGA